MKSKWLVVALAISLIVNLLLIGFVAGRASGFTPARPGAGPDPTAGFYRSLRFLPESKRDELAPLLRRSRREIFEALSEEPYDPDRVAGALAEVRARITASMEVSHRTFIEVTRDLTSEQRQVLLEAMRHPPGPRGDGFKGRTQRAPGAG